MRFLESLKFHINIFESVRMHRCILILVEINVKHKVFLYVVVVAFTTKNPKNLYVSFVFRLKSAGQYYPNRFICDEPNIDCIILEC